MTPRALKLVAAALVTLACGCKSEDEAHRGYVEKELAGLEAAIAARKESSVITGCASLEVSWPTMPPPLADRIARGCFVEAPRLILQNAIANVVENNRKHPNGGFNCVELFVKGALETLAKHPTTDPALQKLADEYIQLCPAEAAKAIKANGSGG